MEKSLKSQRKIPPKIRVASHVYITATFSEAMDLMTIIQQPIPYNTGQRLSQARWSYDGITAIFTPLSELAPNTEYTATITNGVMHLAGNPLAGYYVWRFTTGTGAMADPEPVTTGKAGNFLILAKSGISTKGTTAE